MLKINNNGTRMTLMTSFLWILLTLNACSQLLTLSICMVTGLRDLIYVEYDGHV